MNCPWGLKPGQDCETCYWMRSGRCPNPQFLNADSLNERVKTLESGKAETADPREADLLREFNQLKNEVQQLTGLINHLRNQVAELKAKKQGKETPTGVTPL